MSDLRTRRGDKEDSDPVYVQDQWRECWGKYKAWQDKLERGRIRATGLSWDDWKSRAEWGRITAREHEDKDKPSRPKQGPVPPTDSEEY